MKGYGNVVTVLRHTSRLIRYAEGTMEAIHGIVSAKPLDGYRVDVVFDTGDKAVFDCSRYLDKPYWRRLKDKSFFNQVFVGYGTLVWPDEIDIGPEDVWDFAERYS